ncbi:antigen 5 like allergen Cul n 1-like [Amblyomma americanum]
MSEVLFAFVLLAAWPVKAQLQGSVEMSTPQSANPNCHNISSGLSAEEKAELLRAHNKLRSQVALGHLPKFKPATNMLALSWDDELADLAQAHARRCGAANEDEYDRKAVKFTTVGRNIGWEASSDPYTDHLSLPHIKVWRSEHKDVEDDVISIYRNSESGIEQFTQLE